MVAPAGLWFLVGIFTSSLYRSVLSQSIPSTWRKPSVAAARAECIQQAQAAIDRSISALPAPASSQFRDWLGLAQTCIQMADFDALTGQNKYRQALTGYIAAAERAQPGFLYEYTRGGIAFGYAAARAYETYKDKTFLDFAIEAWNWGKAWTVSDEDTNAGAIAGKNFTLQKTCDGASLAGGTFGLNVTNDPGIDSWSTGNFLVLSSSLYKMTSNETYLSAANATAKFLRKPMYLGQGSIASTLSGNETENCKMDRTAFGYNSGIVMQGLSLLNFATPSTNDDALIRDLVVGESSNLDWHSADGVLSTTDASGIYIPRGLIQIYNSSTDTVLRDYISAYLSTQYNAVVDNAAGSGNVYGPSWTGPPASGFDAKGQSKAISALLAGIVVSNESGLTTASNVIPFPTSPASSSAPPDSSTPKTSVASIVGSVLGGLAFVAGVTVFVVVFLRYREQRRQNTLASDTFLELTTNQPSCHAYKYHDRFGD
ncbi:hypothetical protein VNI00_012179 [Paramarasmius palmivorus]|uniref:Glycoside hydrolase family 76 protein n=1 Tax=Paramarasmius palmivorus TaxID=297713 RepID=A0AAW0C8X2_9AGAR